jgi:D-cysteine desulfhydrase family pyridoxal phosphate-dependent enzyme
MDLDKLPRLPLAHLPTPLQRAKNLEAVLGATSPRIYIKRDDLTGLAFGGNKVRKLEFLVADALANSATVLITEGAAHSNHARVTAAAAVVAGLRAVLILDTRNGADIVGNLLLDHLMGAEVRLVPDPPARRALMKQVSAELAAAGERPYLIPTGGSVPLGAAGYVMAVRELLTQLEALGEAPTHLYFASGSFGTQAGSLVGARAFKAPFAVTGIADAPFTDESLIAASMLATDTAALLDLPFTFTPDDITLVDGFHGGRYGAPTETGRAAIEMLARTEAHFLDPVYSGKAMAALIAHVQAGQFSPDDSIVFLHTGGGPSVFGLAPPALAE